MEEVLVKAGIRKKESRIYLHLLDKGAQTAAEIAKELNESRTNTYMIMERLVRQGLIKINEDKNIRRFEAANPDALKNIFVERQQKLRQEQVALNKVLPQLASIYSLGRNKPGVVYFEGIEGYKRVQEDMAKATEVKCILASAIVPENKEAWDVLQKAVKKRRTLGSKAQIVFHEQAKKIIELKSFQKGYEVKFWGKEPLDGEIAVYGNNIVLTVYKPKLIVTVVTNDILARTLKSVFDQIWFVAKA